MLHSSFAGNWNPKTLFFWGGVYCGQIILNCFYLFIYLFVFTSEEGSVLSLAPTMIEKDLCICLLSPHHDRRKKIKR
jgi:hypothetical protein